jgi:uncharacterized protein YndB with AHSA1/START domain
VSVNRVVADAPPSMVFAILVDPEAYPYWVVGTRAIRGWDNEWPKLGSCLHHRAGVGPLVIEDSSEVLAVEPDHRLTLEVRIGWLGVGAVDVALEPIGPGTATLVTLAETTTGGMFNTIPSMVLEPLLHARNGLSLRRLARLAKSRQALVDGHPGDVQVGGD